MLDGFFSNITAYFFSAQKCKTFSGPKPNKPCVFPFDYKGFTHFDCITVEHDQLWCSTEVHANGGHVDGNWGNCGDECFSGKGLFTNYVYKRRGVASQKFRLFVNHYKVKNVNRGR